MALVRLIPGIASGSRRARFCMSPMYISPLTWSTHAALSAYVAGFIRALRVWMCGLEIPPNSLFPNSLLDVGPVDQRYRCVCDERPR